MRDVIVKVYDLYGRVLLAFAIVAGAATFLIMWVINVNAFSRKLFNAPLPAGVELTQSLLPFVIMLPFGFALFARQHVSSIFLTSHLPPAVTRILFVFWMAVGFVLFAAATYGTFQYALRSYNMNEQVWGATIRFPVWPSKMAISLGTGLLAIQFLLEAVRGIVAPDPNELRSAPPEEFDEAKDV